MFSPSHRLCFTKGVSVDWYQLLIIIQNRTRDFRHLPVRTLTTRYGNLAAAMAVASLVVSGQLFKSIYTINTTRTYRSHCCTGVRIIFLFFANAIDHPDKLLHYKGVPLGKSFICESIDWLIDGFFCWQPREVCLHYWDISINTRVWNTFTPWRCNASISPLGFTVLR